MKLQFSKEDRLKIMTTAAKIPLCLIMAGIKPGIETDVAVGILLLGLTKYDHVSIHDIIDAAIEIDKSSRVHALENLDKTDLPDEIKNSLRKVISPKDTRD